MKIKKDKMKKQLQKWREQEKRDSARRIPDEELEKAAGGVKNGDYQ